MAYFFHKIITGIFALQKHLIAQAQIEERFRIRNSSPLLVKESFHRSAFEWKFNAETVIGRNPFSVVAIHNEADIHEPLSNQYLLSVASSLKNIGVKQHALVAAVATPWKSFLSKFNRFRNHW